MIDQVDLVLLTTPPHFRPLHLAYAVEKGVNAFVEKPMAVDGPGLRKYIQACKDAQAKNLSLVNGFCWRYDGPRRQTMKRVIDGQIGDVVAIETTYNSQGVWEPRKTREQCTSDMEYQMRNWYYYSWLSGDHIVEQAVHGIDTIGLGHERQAASEMLGRRRPPVTHRSQVRQYLGSFLGRLRISRTTSAATISAVTGSTRPRRSKTTSWAARERPTSSATRSPAPNKWQYRGPKNQACTRSSTTRCSPRSAPASRSTTARKPRRARCWP